jgi:hypothetical protein
MVTPRVEFPVRVGVFREVPAAARAVRGLLDAGIAVGQISVVCSDPAKEARFREFEHSSPAGSATPGAAAAGAMVGAVAGGILGVAGGILGMAGDAAAGGAIFAVVEPIVIGTGAAFGGYVGAMMSRGVEHEVANYYDQAMRRGDILVAADVGEDGDPSLLDRAERVFTELGANSVALHEG